MSFHNAETALSLHILNAFTFANAAARLAASGYTLTSADIGKVAVQTDTSRYYILLNNSPISWSEITSPATASGGVNYAPGTDSTAEDAVGDWVLYTDAAKNIPQTGVASATTNLTLVRSTSNPLRGQASFLLTAAAANVQGKGCSLPITIDSADQAKVLAVTFDYNADGTNFIASDGITPPLNDNTTSINAGNSSVEVFVYDITNAQLIYVTPQVIATKSATNNFSFKGSFQTNSNSVAYRLILHCARSESSGWTLKFDNVFVGPQAITAGAPVTDWVDYVPVYGNLGTVSTNTAVWRQVGDSIELRWIFDMGTGVGSPATITIPAGLTVNQSGTVQECGHFSTNDNTYFDVTVTTNGDGVSTLVLQNNNATLSANLNGSVFAGSTHFIGNAKVKVKGWGSSLQLSNDTDTRVVVAQYNVGSTAVTANQPIDFSSFVYDTHTAVTVGASWKFTAPVSGYYRVVLSGAERPISTGNGINVYKNGILYGIGPILSFGTAATYYSGEVTVKLTAGEYVDLRCDGTITIVPGAVCIERLSGPATIAVNESVMADYNGCTATISGSDSDVTWLNKSVDTHGMVSGANVTVPMSGRYNFSGQLYIQGTAALNKLVDIRLLKGASVLKSLQFIYGGPITASMTIPFSFENISLAAGDTVRVQVSSDISTPVITASTERNFLSILRVGN